MPRGHMIEHLADRLADQVQFAAAAGARLMLEIEPHVLAGRCAGRLGRSGRDLGILTVAMTRVWQKLPVVARPMFTHADIIISRVWLHLEALIGLLQRVSF